VSKACGFDFGTSNTSIARWTGKGPHLIELQEGRTSIPTALFFAFEDAGIHFGRDAIKYYLLRDEGRLMRALKSLLGTALFEEATYIRSLRVEFSDIIALFIRHVRETAGNADSVVMGRPVFFVDDDPEADARAQSQLEGAARSAGFSHVEFQLEPIAAALDYEQSVSGEELALVIDIGGGTSDFSLVRVSPERARRADRKSDILATSGVHVGGTDFDRLLSVATVMPFLGMNSRLKTKNMNPPSWYYQDLATWQRINFLYDSKVATEIKGVRRESAEPEKIDRLLRVIERRLGHALLGQIEDTKIALSTALDAKLASAAFDDGKILKVTRTQFEKAVAASMARVGAKIRDTIALAGLGVADVETVFVTGGSASIPLLRRIVAEVLPDARVIEGDAFGSVATGLAIEAHRRFGA
jgi:hypothetical chaperone protein